MKYLRENDDNCYFLAKIQANLFERSSNDNYSSYFFAKVFFNSPYAHKMDDLSFLSTSISEDEIYSYVTDRLKMKDRGVIYPPHVMYWIGYLLREWSYRYGVASFTIMRYVSMDYLASVYNPYHSLDVLKAIQKIAEAKNIDLNEDPNERLRIILSKTY